MFGGNSDTPRLTNFAEAERYMRETAPMKTGPNRGLIPLLRSRANSNTRNIYEGYPGNHPYTNETGLRNIRCRLHSTDVVIFWEDGTIELDSYHSMTTNEFQRSILGWDVCTVNSYKRVNLPTHYMHNIDMCPFLKPASEHPRSRVAVLFAPMGSLYFVPAPNSTYTVHNYGVPIGITRRYYDKWVGKAVHAAQKTLRQMAMFSQTDKMPELEGTAELAGGLLTARYESIRNALVAAGWAPGKQMDADALNVLLESWGTHRPYLERMEHLRMLRLEPRSAVSYGDRFEDVVSLPEAEDLCIEIERLEQGCLWDEEI